MERVILLKTQLAEAAKLAIATDFAHQRLAVILLDNFIEIQLSSLMKKKFSYDDMFLSKPPKYNYALRKQITYNYDVLLKSVIDESIITADERDLLVFCHDVRNNLYHKIEEEHLVTSIALQFLVGLINKYQPQWRSGRDIMSWNMKTKDPYATADGNRFMHDTNTEAEWTAFLVTHFNCIPTGTKTPAELLTEHLANKIERAKEHYEFLLEEYAIFSPGSKDWKLNEFLRWYSFFNVNDFEIKRLQKEVGAVEYNSAFKKLIVDYANKWRPVNENRLLALENGIKKLQGGSGHQALVKFKSYRKEVYMIHEALSRAVGDLEAQIDIAIDHQKEMSRR